MKFKQFLMLEENVNAYWAGFNWLTAFGLSYLTYLAGDSVTWAVTALPIARIVSEMITRYLNKEKAFVGYAKND